MKSAVSGTVLVACPPSGEHKLRVRLRRYEWSAAEDVYVRLDGLADEVYLRKTGDGLQSYPRPKFKCPVAGCGRSAVYKHENFQTLLQRAAEADGVLYI